MNLPFVPKITCPNCGIQPHVVLIGEETCDTTGCEHRMRCTACNEVSSVKLEVVKRKSPRELSEEMGHRTLSPDGTS